MAVALGKAAHTAVAAGALPFSTFAYRDRDRDITFTFKGWTWTCDVGGARCRRAAHRAPGPGDSVSPDGKWIAYTNGYDIWVRASGAARGRPLSRDGVAHDAYGAMPEDDTAGVTSQRFPAPSPPQLIWSPNSKFVLTYQLDERRVRKMYVTQSTPQDGTVRPRLYEYRYPLPGDADVAMQRPVVFDVASGRRTVLHTPPLIGELLPIVAARYAWWSADSRHVYFLRRDRFSKWLGLNVADPANGRVREIVRETSSTWIRDNYDNDYSYATVRTLANGDVIWMSDRDGWAQLYYYDGATGRLRNRITAGKWVVRRIVHVDEAQRAVYFTAGGVDPARNPYDECFYRAALDGRGLKLLTPEDAEHYPANVTDQPYSPAEAETYAFSPSGRYFVDTYSTPDQAPVFVVRAASGRLVARLETADISKLQHAGFTPVEAFQAVAADGKTAIYGNINRPSNFDPAKKYPVIDAIYSGPQSIRAWKTFGEANFDVFYASSLAELGFIVVSVDGRGTPQRSRAFWDPVYRRLQDASNIADHVAAIRQLAQRYPSMDVDRVGIWGASGGGNGATRAMLDYPDFFKVAVAAEGNHDPRNFLTAWGERFIGPLAENRAAYRAAANEPLVSHLRGKLFLMQGELDDDVSPSQSLKLVDALIRANKDFDLLIVPNENHDAFATSPYFIRRMWDFFVRNLAGAEPPAGYIIKAPN